MAREYPAQLQHDQRSDQRSGNDIAQVMRRHDYAREPEHEADRDPQRAMAREQQRERDPGATRTGGVAGWKGLVQRLEVRMRKAVDTPGEPEFRARPPGDELDQVHEDPGDRDARENEQPPRGPGRTAPQ